MKLFSISVPAFAVLVLDVITNADIFGDNAVECGS
jgi:hypothetical protein